MTKHKVSTLEGALLDAAVAKAEGWSLEVCDGEESWHDADEKPRKRPLPWSSMWEFGGPISEREHLSPFWTGIGGDYEGWICQASLPDVDHSGDPLWIYRISRPRDNMLRGHTYLIAAMRAYVSSKFGDEVELP